jgi:hypothetical protein
VKTTIRSVTAVLLLLVSVVTFISAFNLPKRSLDPSSQLASSPTAAKSLQQKLAPGLEATRSGPGRELPAASTARAIKAYGNLPLAFEANRGQTDPEVGFLAQAAGYTLFLTGNEAVLALRGGGGSQHNVVGAKKVVPQRSLSPAFPELQAANPKDNSAQSGSAQQTKDKRQAMTSDAVLRMRLVGADANTAMAGIDELPGKTNYFIGNDPKKWRTDVPSYSKVRYESVYRGIDLIYYGNQGQLEYDFVVAPGADPKAIALGVAGEGAVPDLRIDPGGDLVVRLNSDEIRFHKPVAYQNAEPTRLQNRKFVEASYVLESRNRIGIRVGKYDAALPLVIDPVLVYSSYLGGSAEEQIFAIAVDSQGNAYLTGFTQSTDFPRLNQIPGTCQGSCGSSGHIDTFVTKINAAGNALVYSTRIGGSGNQYGNGIAVDGEGDVYLIGDSTSTDFPIVFQIPGACQGSCFRGTDYDVFALKINAAGDTLVYSSYIGGSGLDEGYGIAIDGSGNAYLGGFTTSTDYPRVNQIPGACEAGCGQGNLDVFVTKVNAAGTALVYSSYIGGNGGDRCLGIAVDSSGNAYLTGETISTDFPRVNQVPGACLGACGTGADFDVFVTKVNAAGSALVYSSYVGGSLEDFGYIYVDGPGNVYLTGYTESTDFPRVNQIPGACQGTCGNGNGNSHGFVTKIDAAGATLVYSSLLGGSGNDEGFEVAVDNSGNAYVEGFTSSANFPRLNQIPGACLGNCGTGANFDAFVTEINAAGNALVYSSYLGGSGDDDHGFLAGIALDSMGNVYIGGETHSTDFPRVNQISGACQGTCGTAFSGGDAFVTKISYNAPLMAQSAFSRKTHGAAGIFDIPLPLTGSVGIECRSGGDTNDYQMIINFANSVTVESASVTSGTGGVSSFSVSGSHVTVNLTGVTNVQTITVTLFNVNDGTHMGNIPVSMGVLVGDVNGNAIVNASDVSLDKSQAGQPVTMSNFREDVNASGSISATDVAQVKANVGHALP